MPQYRAPIRDYQFVLHELLELDQFAALERFNEASADTINAVLQQGARFCEEVLHPLQRVGDVEGCTFDAGSVKTPNGFKQAYADYVEGGWPSLSGDPAYGGQGLPDFLNLAFGEMTTSTNMAFYMYPGLIAPAVRSLCAGGSRDQKDRYLPKLVSGEWGATMNLTEPHCGTDLGLLRTKAVPNADGSYAITGQKIWITSGEHDLTENIIHLVLARIEGGPSGSKGISLFLVPKFLLDENDVPGERNLLACGGLEEKMGLHGSATCVMNYDGAKGWLIGEPHKGLMIMFHMMNEARLGCGMQGLALAETAYQYALAFAKDRLQGRALTGDKTPDQMADPIIVHPDVRRMLMDQKVFVEAGRALLMWVAVYGDLEQSAEDDAVREKASDYMALLTPVVKAYLTDKGYESISAGLQVHGGSGFTEEWGMSQLLRDARITQIYEGTNGVQALDLVGRKLTLNGMRPIRTFFAEIDDFIQVHSNTAELSEFLSGLADAKTKLEDATDWLVTHTAENPDNAGAGSTDYLHLFGLTAFAYMWARMAKVANEKVQAGSDDPIYAAKLTTGRFFLKRWLPEAETRLANVKSGAAMVMALPVDQF